MKKFAMVLVAVLLFGAALVTQASATVEASGDVYVGYYDKYLWRGFDLSGGQPVVQGGTDISLGAFTVSYWTNIQASGDDGLTAGEGNETDIVLDYSFEVGPVAVSVGDIFYALDGLDDTHELYLSMGLDTILAPSLSVYYDWDECEEDGLFLAASIGHGIEVGPVAISAGALVSFNQESDYAVGDYSGWHNYELSLGLDYSPIEAVTISPSVLFSEGISDSAKDAIDSEWLSGVSIAYAF